MNQPSLSHPQTPTRTLISGGRTQFVEQTFHEHKKVSKATCEHLNSLGNWTHSVTLTYKKFNPLTHSFTTNDDILKSTKVFLNTMNTSIYGHGATRKGYRIASIGSLGLGAYGSHPHVHLSLEMPVSSDPKVFTNLIYTNAKKVTLINQ